MDIELPYTVGDYQTVLKLEQPYGSGGGYHIYLDKRYHGQICKMSDGWHVYINPNSELSSDDIQIILEAVEKY